jgi:hemoglobin-like flavoprotein
MSTTPLTAVASQAMAAETPKVTISTTEPLNSSVDNDPTTFSNVTIPSNDTAVPPASDNGDIVTAEAATEAATDAAATEKAAEIVSRPFAKLATFFSSLFSKKEPAETTPPAEAAETSVVTVETAPTKEVNVFRQLFAKGDQTERCVEKWNGYATKILGESTVQKVIVITLALLALPITLIASSFFFAAHAIDLTISKLSDWNTKKQSSAFNKAIAALASSAHKRDFTLYERTLSHNNNICIPSIDGLNSVKKAEAYACKTQNYITDLNRVFNAFEERMNTLGIKEENMAAYVQAFFEMVSGENSQKLTKLIKKEHSLFSQTLMFGKIPLKQAGIKKDLFETFYTRMIDNMASSDIEALLANKGELLSSKVKAMVQAFSKVAPALTESDVLAAVITGIQAKLQALVAQPEKPETVTEAPVVVVVENLIDTLKKKLEEALKAQEAAKQALALADTDLDSALEQASKRIDIQPSLKQKFLREALIANILAKKDSSVLAAAIKLVSEKYNAYLAASTQCVSAEETVADLQKQIKAEEDRLAAVAAEKKEVPAVIPTKVMSAKDVALVLLNGTDQQKHALLNPVAVDANAVINADSIESVDAVDGDDDESVDAVDGDDDESVDALDGFENESFWTTNRDRAMDLVNWVGSLFGLSNAEENGLTNALDAQAAKVDKAIEN